MKKLTLFIFSIAILLLSACQQTDPSAISLEKVLAAFYEQELPLEKSNMDDSIFRMKLNDVTPSAYDLDGKMLTIYIYHSTSERETGLEDFRKKTATMNTVSFNVYEVKNVLIFYVYEREIKSEIEVKIEKIINNLNED